MTDDRFLGLALTVADQAVALERLRAALAERDAEIARLSQEAEHD